MRTRGSNADRPRRGGAGGRGPSFRANAPQSLRLAGASERITSAAQIDPLAAPRPFPSAHTPPRRPTQERATGTTPRTGAPVAGRALAARRPRVRNDTQLAGRSETRVAPRDTHTRHTHTDPFSFLRPCVSRLPPRSARRSVLSRYYLRTTGTVLHSSRILACVIAGGCVGHASVHCDSGPRAPEGPETLCVVLSSNCRIFLYVSRSRSGAAFGACAYLYPHPWHQKSSQPAFKWRQ